MVAVEDKKNRSIPKEAQDLQLRRGGGIRSSARW